MPKFIFAYHGGKRPESESEIQKTYADWGVFYDKMGAAVTDGGGPAGQSKTVSKDSVAGDGGANPLSGYTVVEAPSLDKAVELAKDCPMVKDGSGSVEVCEIIQM